MQPKSPAGSAVPTNPAKLVASLKGHVGGVIALTFSSDRCLVASSSQDATAKIWNIASSSPGERATIRMHGDKFHSLAFAPNNRTIAIGSGAPNGMVWLYDVSDSNPQEIAT